MSTNENKPLLPDKNNGIGKGDQNAEETAVQKHAEGIDDSETGQSAIMIMKNPGSNPPASNENKDEVIEEDKPLLPDKNNGIGEGDQNVEEEAVQKHVEGTVNPTKNVRSSAINENKVKDEKDGRHGQSHSKRKETVEINLNEINDPVNEIIFRKNHDDNFWAEVDKKYDDPSNTKTDDKGRKYRTKSWIKCLDEARAYKIKTICEKNNRDPVVYMIEAFDKFREKANADKKDLLPDQVLSNAEKKELLPDLKRQIAEFAKILIMEDYDNADENEDPKYQWRLKAVDGEEKSVLHYAAEYDIREIAEILVNLYPDQVYLTTDRLGQCNRMPVELALEKFSDDIASFLIVKMRHDRVRSLFLLRDDEDNERGKERCFKFQDFIKRDDMKKTVIAVLDCLINPDWPTVPVRRQDEEEKEYNSISEPPLRYHFYYRILDGDEYGRQPNSKGNFNHRSTSCLHEICQSPHNTKAIRHPVVRMLVRRKWDQFAKKRVWFYASIYIIYLALMSFALLQAVLKTDPRKYPDPLDQIRLGCEILTIVLAVMYFLLEIDQMEKERGKYFYGKLGEYIYNYLDLIGIFGILVIIPLRFANLSAQWFVASIAYSVNFLRIFKYSSAYKFIGLYSKVIARFAKDIGKFLVVYAVVVLSLSGSICLAFRAAQDEKGFSDIIFRGVRALVEADTFADRNDYAKYSLFAVILIIIFMLVVFVLLINILIAQLSCRYETAQEEASVQYDIDKALIVTGLEDSRFRNWSLRIKYYEEGGFLNDSSKIKDLLSGWDDLHPENLTKNELKEIRDKLKCIFPEELDKFLIRDFNHR